MSCKKYFYFLCNYISYYTQLRERSTAFTFKSTTFHIYYYVNTFATSDYRSCPVHREPSYLFIDELEASRVSRRVEPSVQDDPQGVQLHGWAEASGHSCGAGHGGTGVDLQEPRS